MLLLDFLRIAAVAERTQVVLLPLLAAGSIWPAVLSPTPHWAGWGQQWRCGWDGWGQSSLSGASVPQRCPICPAVQITPVQSWPCSFKQLQWLGLCSIPGCPWALRSVAVICWSCESFHRSAVVTERQCGCVAAGRVCCCLALGASSAPCQTLLSSMPNPLPDL